MDLSFRVELIDALVKAGVKSTVFHSDIGHKRAKIVDSIHIAKDDLEIIRKTAGDAPFNLHPENKRLLNRLKLLASLKDVDESAPIKKLEALPEMIREYLKAPYWVFLQDNGIMLPYFMESIRYTPPQRSMHGSYPAYVTIYFKAIKRGKHKDEQSIIYASQLKDKKGKPITLIRLLKRIGVYAASPEMLEQYAEELTFYQKWSTRTGVQFLGTGMATPEAEDDDNWAWWRRGSAQVSLDRNASPARLVMDDAYEAGKNSPVCKMGFWDATAKTKEDQEDDEDEESFDDGDDETSKKRLALANGNLPLLPVHCYVRMFNLGTHEYMTTHVMNLKKYEYDATLINKLVLPNSNRNLIDALTSGKAVNVGDIVKGKAHGIIILCAGVPGTGKTLTAEVYAEHMKRPLYTVQCSQLGVSSTELESNLGEILERAARWKAVLLIDEADVYVHERGESLVQNAIVGVFLRLLEYYNGILFLTTNRAEIIDDAILSRCTALIEYHIPAGEDRNRLWKVILNQFKIVASKGFIHRMVEKFPSVSGRTIRQLVKLGLILSKRKGATGSLAKHVIRASKFHFLQREEKEDA